MTLHWTVLFLPFLVQSISAQLRQEQLDDLPRAISLLSDYQLTFVQQEKATQLRLNKERINGPSGNFTPIKSPVQVLQGLQTEHLHNHSVSAIEWAMTYSGQDVVGALLIFFTLCPIFFGHFVRRYVYRLLKPTISVKHKSNFPVIPLKYLQETKDEQRVFLPSRNTLRWAAMRYIIMASDNVVNLKMLHYGKGSEEMDQVKYRKHRAWFILRIMAKFNAIYTRKQMEKEGEEAGLDKLKQLAKIRRLQARQEEIQKIAEQEAERIRRAELGESDEDDNKKRPLYKLGIDKTGLRKYAYDLRHPDDRASIVVDGERVMKPEAVKRRTSLEIVYEGLRRGMANPSSRLSLERLRQFSDESIIHGPAEPEPEQKPEVEEPPQLSEKAAMKAAAMQQKHILRHVEQANRSRLFSQAPAPARRPSLRTMSLLELEKPKTSVQETSKEAAPEPGKDAGQRDHVTRKHGHHHRHSHGHHHTEHAQGPKHAAAPINPPHQKNRRDTEESRPPRKSGAGGATHARHHHRHHAAHHGRHERRATLDPATEQAKPRAATGKHNLHHDPQEHHTDAPPPAHHTDAPPPAHHTDATPRPAHHTHAPRKEHHTDTSPRPAHHTDAPRRTTHHTDTPPPAHHTDATPPAHHEQHDQQQHLEVPARHGHHKARSPQGSPKK